MDKNEIYKKYHLLAPGETEQYLVIGDDIDSFLSAMLFIKYHPAATVIGFYEQYKTLFLIPSYRYHLPKTLWVDLDIYHPQCNSLGHHILRFSKQDMLHGLHNSCNPNELRGIDCGNFTHKYPLGTIHFLMSLYEESYIPGSDAELLFWLADSSYINGQQHRFRNNVEEWLTNFLRHDQLRQTFQAIDSETFEIRMKSLYEELISNGFKQGWGQISSRHLNLSGFQFQCSFRETDYFKKICSYLAQKTGLPDLSDHMNIGKITQTILGTRKTDSAQVALKSRTIDSFLNDEHVFSYVFPHRKTINYTSGINL